MTTKLTAELLDELEDLAKEAQKHEPYAVNVGVHVKPAALLSLIAAARASLESRGAPQTRDAEGYRVIWDWEPYARFLGARAQLIKEKRAEGLSWEAIARELSCEAMQVQLIGMSELSGICGIPGAVWPPKEHQKPEPPSAAVAEPLASPALAAEARASARLDGETHCLPEESMADNSLPSPPKETP
jgi:hypothetical protein